MKFLEIKRFLAFDYINNIKTCFFSIYFIFLLISIQIIYVLALINKKIIKFTLFIILIITILF